jgi:hypothetical protein
MPKSDDGYQLVEHSMKESSPTLGSRAAEVFSFGGISAKNETTHSVTVMDGDGNTGSGSGRSAESATRAAIRDCKD